MLYGSIMPWYSYFIWGQEISLYFAKCWQLNPTLKLYNEETHKNGLGQVIKDMLNVWNTWRHDNPHIYSVFNWLFRGGWPVLLD